jgi:membrane fusion protein, type I secretion system
MMDHFDVEKLSSWMKDLNLSLSRLNMVALTVIVAIFGFGGVWSVTAKIGGVIAAPGRVVATGQNQVVQHLEGGIIEAIYAREGDIVSKGSLLAELDVAPLNSQYYSTRIQALILELELDRWRSLKNGSTELSVDLSNYGELASDERVLATFEAQSALLVSNEQTMEHSLTEFDVSIDSAEKNITSINEVITALTTQIDLLTEELDGLQQLFEKGLEPRTRVLALRREIAQLSASKFQAEFEVIKAQNTIVSTQQKREATILQFGENASENIARLQRAINSIIDL